jgi:hypothetical protein
VLREERQVRARGADNTSRGQLPDPTPSAIEMKRVRGKNLREIPVERLGPEQSGFILEEVDHEELDGRDPREGREEEGSVTR